MGRIGPLQSTLEGECSPAGTSCCPSTAVAPSAYSCVLSVYSLVPHPAKGLMPHSAWCLPSAPPAGSDGSCPAIRLFWKTTQSHGCG